MEEKFDLVCVVVGLSGQVISTCGEERKPCGIHQKNNGQNFLHALMHFAEYTWGHSQWCDISDLNLISLDQTSTCFLHHAHLLLHVHILPYYDNPCLENQITPTAEAGNAIYPVPQKGVVWFSRLWQRYTPQDSSWSRHANHWLNTMPSSGTCIPRPLLHFQWQIPRT